MAVRYGISIRIYASKKYMVDFSLAVVKADHQTAKFNSLPRFLSIRYLMKSMGYDEKAIDIF